MPAVDHFPSTHGTWLEERLTLIDEAAPAALAGDAAALRRRNGALDELRQHIMRRYTPALTAYVSAPALRSIALPEELVSGFYAKAMGDTSFLQRWRQSGLSLRRWLMNAISFHCMSVRRDSHRDARRAGESIDYVSGGLIDDAPDAVRAFDRAWALSLANEAYANVQQSLSAADRGDDDRIFRMHVVDGLTYAAIGQQLGISQADALAAVRRVTQALRTEITALLWAEGVPSSQLEPVLTEILGLVDSDSQ